jgi:DNA-binding transcriptional LysR family regulator
MSNGNDRPDRHGLAELSKIDLNLLVAFEVLASERSVSRAATRVGVTQSAMSHTLRRLRELFDDALLVRGRGGAMVLTARAESLVAPVRGGLLALERALEPPDRFTPATARREFHVAAPDLFEVLVIPTLLERIRQEAPGVDITVVTARERLLADQLESGEVDVAIVISPELDELRRRRASSTPAGWSRRTLARDGYVCLMRADHPALTAKRRSRGARNAQARLSLERYVALSHALISPTGQGPGLVDHVLERHGLRRRVALRIPHFYAALAIIAHSDLVLTAPSALAAAAPDHLSLVTTPPPVPLPRHQVDLVWHERLSDDAGHRWLRQLVAESARLAIGGRPR